MSNQKSKVIVKMKRIKDENNKNPSHLYLNLEVLKINHFSRDIAIYCPYLIYADLLANNLYVGLKYREYRYARNNESSFDISQVLKD